MMYKKILFLFFMLYAAFASAKTPYSISNMDVIFRNNKVEGSILIFDYNNKQYWGYNIERCNTAFCPASTFKIPNTLIAIENGIITTDSIFRWDGEKRRLKEWETDMTIREAFRTSCVPIYQGIAETIGTDRMKEYVQLFHFGEMDINKENINTFWLHGKSAITQYQQIYFLLNLYESALPLKDKTMDTVKDMMLLEDTAEYKLRGKTGWATNGGKDIGWFVGYLEKDNNVYFFATNIVPTTDTDMNKFGQIRIDMTRTALSEVCPQTSLNKNN